MKEPKQFTGIEKKHLINGSGELWGAIYDLNKKFEDYERSQTIMNYLQAFVLILSVSMVVTIYLFKL